MGFYRTSFLELILLLTQILFSKALCCWALVIGPIPIEWRCSDNCWPQETRSRDVSVGIGTMLLNGTLGNTGFDCRQGIFLFPKRPYRLYSLPSLLSSRYPRSVPACKVVVAWTWTLTYMWSRCYEHVELYPHSHVSSSWCGRGELNELHRVSLCGTFNCRNLQQQRQCTYKRKMEARSRYHCCRGKAASVTYSECVSVSLSYPACKAHGRIVLSAMVCLTVHYFSTLSH